MPPCTNPFFNKGCTLVIRPQVIGNCCLQTCSFSPWLSLSEKKDGLVTRYTTLSTKPLSSLFWLTYLFRRSLGVHSVAVKLNVSSQLALRDFSIYIHAGIAKRGHNIAGKSPCHYVWIWDNTNVCRMLLGRTYPVPAKASLANCSWKAVVKCPLSQ